MARGRQGSALLLLILAAGVLLTLAAVVAPVLVGSREHARVVRTADTLAIYSRAIANFKLHIGNNPGTVTQLTRQIVLTDLNSCGGTYSSQQLVGDGEVWKGPYVTRVVPAHGSVPIGIGALQNAFSREPILARSRTEEGILLLTLTGVLELDARLLDRRVDGSISSTTGTVRWGAPDADGFVTLTYRINILGC